MTPASRTGIAATSIVLLLSGCASTGATVPEDPWERVNRGTYAFNNALDRTLLRPAAIGYRRHVPRFLRIGISNVLENLSFPTVIVNDLLQLKLGDTVADIGRFVLNSTLGLGGLLDPATDAGIRHNDEDFGQTLGRWGVPSGPFLVLPILGPSTLRDAPALAADTQTDLRVVLHLEPIQNAALAVLSAVEFRTRYLAADQMLESAFDRYAFVRNAWLQRREFHVHDGEVHDQAPLEEEFEDPGDQSGPAKNPETSLIPASAPSTGGGFL